MGEFKFEVTGGEARWAVEMAQQRLVELYEASMGDEDMLPGGEYHEEAYLCNTLIDRWMLAGGNLQLDEDGCYDDGTHEPSYQNARILWGAPQ